MSRVDYNAVREAVRAFAVGGAGGMAGLEGFNFGNFFKTVIPAVAPVVGGAIGSAIPGIGTVIGAQVGSAVGSALGPTPRQGPSVVFTPPTSPAPAAGAREGAQGMDGTILIVGALVLLLLMSRK